MATGGTDAKVEGLGEGTMQFIPPFRLVNGSGTELFSVSSAGAVVCASTITASGTQDANGNLTITNTAPQVSLVDSTSSAKGLLISCDANKAQLMETAGSAGSLLTLDLANNRVGVATASPTVPLDVTGAAAISGALAVTGAVTGSAAVSVGTVLKLAGIETGLTAHAGGTQGAALALSATKTIHNVGTVGTAADSIVLPAATGSGTMHLVKNSAAANSLQLFGLSTDTIDGVASGTGVAIAAGKSRLLVDFASGTWFSLLGA